MRYIFNCLQILRWFFQVRFMTDTEKDLELRSQLALTQQKIINKKISKPCFTSAFRQLWVLLSKFFPMWKSTPFIVKPETIIRWHKTAFEFYWKRKSKGGRPKISHSTIALIKRIHKENPLLPPEKIRERLIDLSISDTPASNTIAKYICDKRTLPTERQPQSWQTFLKNQANGIWAMDFAVSSTLNFKVLYILVILSHERRKIEHFAVTANPTSAWLIQQIREVTSFGKQSKYLIHDNDAVFRSGRFQQFLLNSGIKSKHTAFHSPWQNSICERLIGILRRELLDHIIPINQRHLEYLLCSI